MERDVLRAEVMECDVLRAEVHAGISALGAAHRWIVNCISLLRLTTPARTWQHLQPLEKETSEAALPILSWSSLLWLRLFWCFTSKFQLLLGKSWNFQKFQKKTEVIPSFHLFWIFQHCQKNSWNDGILEVFFLGIFENSNFYLVKVVFFKNHRKSWNFDQNPKKTEAFLMFYFKIPTFTR